MVVTPRNATEAVTEVGDKLQRAVVISTDRINSVLEDAVVRGRMTRRDAEDLAANLLGQAQDLRGELARTVADKVALPGKAARRRLRPSADTQATYIDHHTGRADVPRDPASVTARELIELTATLSPAELAVLREREAAGKARATVLKAIDQQLGA